MSRVQEARINGVFQLLINGVYWGYNPLILTIDPNFLGHPSNLFFFGAVWICIVRIAPVPCVVKNYALSLLTDIPWTVFVPGAFTRIELKKFLCSREIWVFPKIMVPQNGW